jgi:hypothetical protein
MSLFSWLTSARKPAKTPADSVVSSGLSRMESTKPYPGRPGAEAGNGRPANRKSERMARRELLYGVVRDCMSKAGVISASYKFKVLSLDSRGRQFLIMVDLAREYGNETSGLAETEAMIAQSAKQRYDILVSAVYWRMNEHVAVGINTGRAALKPSASRPAPLEAQAELPLNSGPAELHSGPAPLVSQPSPLDAAGPLARPGARFEAIQADEVEAFKKALAKGVSASEALAAAGGSNVARGFDGSVKHGPQSYTLLTGFEDTEMADDQPPRALSSTQYGDLG